MASLPDIHSISSFAFVTVSPDGCFSRYAEQQAQRPRQQRTRSEITEQVTLKVFSPASLFLSLSRPAAMPRRTGIGIAAFII